MFEASSSKTEVQYDGLGDVLHAMYEEQGIKGFYVGINGELFQQALMQTTYFYFYDLFQSKVRNQGGNFKRKLFTFNSFQMFI